MQRKELKFIINALEAKQIKEKLKSLTKNNKKYIVRSLYFDNYQNSCFYDNLEGISPREKYRLRIYDRNFEKIYLECKRKEYNFVNKKFEIICVNGS